MLMALIMLFQTYTIGHIIYRKWSVYQQEQHQPQPIPLFIIRLNECEPQNQNADPPGEVNLNTSSYNKVLVEVTHIFIFIAFVIVRLVLRRIAQSYTSTDIDGQLENIPKVTMYFCDLTPSILISFVFPLLFYGTHPKVRKYVKGLLCC